MKALLTCLALFVLLHGSAASAAETVWIDVRTDAEYSEDHIDGDSHHPLAGLNAQDLAERYGRDVRINLYCRSGNRAGQAKLKLEEAGFNNVHNVGGIDDARRLRELAQPSPAPAATQ